MKRGSIITCVVLALALGSAAQAQVGGSDHPRSGAVHLPLSVSISLSPTVPPTLREARRLKPGMVVLDRHGAKVGIIIRANEVRNGGPSVRLIANGTEITVRTSKFRLTRDGEEAVISLSRSEIRTAAILNAD